MIGIVCQACSAFLERQWNLEEQNELNKLHDI